MNWQPADFPDRSEQDRAEGRDFGERIAPMMARTKQTRRTQFSALPPTDGAIVFLGDSLTDAGEWGEWLPQFDIRNRGISGETALEIVERVAGVRGARAVFVLAGTNDLGRGRSPAEAAHDLERIVAALEADNPEAEIVLQSVMPREAEFAHEVLSLNVRIAELAARGERRQYLDLRAAGGG